MSVMSRFPMGAGGSYAEGTANPIMSGQEYTFDVSGLPFMPQVIYGSIYAYSDTYADTHNTAVENVEGTAKKLIATANGYSANPNYAMQEKGFKVQGRTPPGVGPTFGATLAWKAWG